MDRGRGIIALATLWLAAVACTGQDGSHGEGEPALDNGEGPALGSPTGTATGQANRGGAGISPPVHVLDERPVRTTTGLDSARLGEALRRAESLPRLHNMIVARHGQIEAERHFRGPGPEVPANVKSVSKSLLSALVGIALEEGHLESVDQPIGPTLAAYFYEDAEPAKRAITLGHLLSMRSGLESTSSRNYGTWVTSPNWVRHAVNRPLLLAPGERMVYSTGNTHLVSAMLTQATGESTFAFARSRLAEPLGIRLPAWPRDPQGIYFGGNDMRISPRDLLRFGELFRNGGALDDRRIIPRDWVLDSWRQHARSPRNRNVYGLGWWGRESNGYQIRFAWGYGGQFLFIVPALELTVVFTSDPVSPREGPHNRSLHNLLDEWLVPAAIAGRAAGSAPPPTADSRTAPRPGEGPANDR